MSLLSPIYPRGPINLGNRLRPLSTDLGLPELPGWTLMHTPGHTPGHVSFFRPADRLLLPGDAFCTTKPESFFEAAVAQQAELHGPPSYFTSDWDAARRSVQQLACVATCDSRARSWKTNLRSFGCRGLRTLAANFESVAVPENRK